MHCGLFTYAIKVAMNIIGGGGAKFDNWAESDCAESDWSEPERPELFGGVGN